MRCSCRWILWLSGVAASISPRPELLEFATHYHSSHGPARHRSLDAGENNAGNEDDLVPETAVVCVSLAAAPTVASLLAASVAGSQTIYTSRREDAACSLMYDVVSLLDAAVASLPSAMAVARAQTISDDNDDDDEPWVVSLYASLPKEAKLDPSLFADSAMGDLDQRLDRSPSALFHTPDEHDGVVGKPTGTLTVSFAPGFDWPHSGPHDWLAANAGAALANTAGCNASALVLESWQPHRRQLRNQGATSSSTKSVSDGPGVAVVDLEGLRDEVGGRMGARCWAVAIDALAAEPGVLHVAPRPPPMVRNARGAALIQSSANAGSAYDDATPVWDMGVTGVGEIVGVADTGLDTASCFFSDSSGATGITRSPSSSPTFDLSQSKVVQYVEGVDGEDEVGGHGTHVAGSLAGVVGSGWPDYTSDTSLDSCATATATCSLPNYYSSSACASNTDLCSTEFADGGSYEGACANECYCTTGYFLLTGSVPGSGQTCGELVADSKGAAYDARIAFYDIGDSSGLSLPSNLETTLFAAAYSTGARVHTNSWGLTLFTYDNADLQVDSYMYDNPEMLILVAAGNDGQYGSATTVSSPAQAKSALSVGASLTGRWPSQPSDSSDVSYVASFSASGPTSDGRIKPDLVAPGYSVVSATAASGGASASPTCGVYSTQGTSMSAPLVAGAAALVRQYLRNSTAFRDHLSAVSADLAWECLPGYPDGCASGVNGMALNGGAVAALVKAILLHSTVAMSTWDAATASGSSVPQTLGAPPDNQQGFGRLDLSLSLLSGSSTPANGGLGLWCSDDESVVSSDENTYYFYVVSSGQPLTVTLAWTDPANSVGASKQLLNDLDLTVHHETSGEVFYSNGNSGTADQDEVNPVEKVAVASPATGSYAIKVKASVFPQSASQAFALVITGGGYLVGSGYTWARISSGEAGPTGAPTITFPPSVSPQPTPPPSPLPSPAPTISFRPSLVPSLRPSSVPTAPTPVPTMDSSASWSSALDWLKDHILATGIVFALAVGAVCFCLCRSVAPRRPHNPPLPPVVTLGGVQPHPPGQTTRLPDGRTARLVGGREMAELEANEGMGPYTNSRGTVHVVTQGANQPNRNPAYQRSSTSTKKKPSKGAAKMAYQRGNSIELAASNPVLAVVVDEEPTPPPVQSAAVVVAAEKRPGASTARGAAPSGAQPRGVVVDL